MPTKEEDFTQRFVALMEELRDHRSRPEAMFLVGNLAAHLIDKAGAESWAAYKSGLEPVKRQMLLAELQKTGNKFNADGKTHETYAIQVLAMSVVAGNQEGEVMQQGVALIDKLIGFYIDAYRKAAAMSKAKAG